MNQQRNDGALVGKATSGRKGKIAYCDDCGRIKGVGCACGLTFAEKMRGVSAQVPDHMRAVPRTR